MAISCKSQGATREDAPTHPSGEYSKRKINYAYSTPIEPSFVKT